MPPRYRAGYTQSDGFVSFILAISFRAPAALLSVLLPSDNRPTLQQSAQHGDRE